MKKTDIKPLVQRNELVTTSLPRWIDRFAGVYFGLIILVPVILVFSLNSPIYVERSFSGITEGDQLLMTSPIDSGLYNHLRSRNWLKIKIDNVVPGIVHYTRVRWIGNKIYNGLSVPLFCFEKAPDHLNDRKFTNLVSGSVFYKSGEGSLAQTIMGNK
jgi:hypothetical protein